jgi:predicted RNA-binding Zn-ribbon protein involved in translation (DUF1610 family)
MRKKRKKRKKVNVRGGDVKRWVGQLEIAGTCPSCGSEDIDRKMWSVEAGGYSDDTLYQVCKGCGWADTQNHCYPLYEEDEEEDDE